MSFPHPSKTPPLAGLTLAGLLSLLTFTQMAFGGVLSWTYSITAMSIGILLCILCPFIILKAYGFGPRPMHLHLPPLSIHALLFATLAAVQVMPLPSCAVELISPLRLGLYAPLLSVPDTVTISFNPHAGAIEALKWCPMALAYFMGIYAIRTRRQTEIIIWTVLGLGIFQAAYGIYQISSGTEQVWNWIKTGQHGFVVGTYISRNELAYFLELSVLLALGMAMGVHMREPLANGWKNILDESFWKPVLPGFTAVILAIALLLTGSRGGILSCGGGLISMAVLFLVKKQMRAASIKIFGVAIIIFFYGLGVGLERTAARFGQDGDLEHRLDIAGSVLPMIADYPLSGVGMGAFNTAYSPYALPQYGRNVDVVHAHNDWIEVAAEMGLPGLVLCGSGFAWFMGTSIRSWRKRNDPGVLGTGAGIMAGLISIALHSFFDFGMRVPANALATGLLCALLWTRLHMRTNGKDRSVALPSLEITRALRPAAFLLALLALSTGLLLSKSAWVHYQAERLAPTSRTFFPAPLPSLESIREALRYEPDNPDLLSSLAGKSMELFFQAQILPGPAILLAEKYYRASLQNDPANGITWRNYARVLGFGMEYSIGGDPWAKRAILAYDRAISLRPHDPKTAMVAGHHHLWAHAITQGGNRERGLELLERAVKARPWAWKQILDLAMEHVAEKKELRRFIPAEYQAKALDYIEKKMPAG